MAESILKLNITGDSSKLKSALNSASSQMSSFGSKMQSVGKSMTAKLTLPLVAAGAAATKMAFDFDKSMGQIESLVGIAGDEVKKMGETAKKMAVDTGKSANEAAEALFFITSAGLKGADATDTLNASLKASAVGLGETKVIADLATSAMNAYGAENLNASASTDIMVAAVREGKLEASALAGAMGGVIPLASNMGVGFDEVGAAMAAMSRTGTGAAEGATQLTAILASIKKPTDGAVQSLAKMGLSTEDVQKSLSEDGLLATLEMLQSGLKQTGQDTTAIFPNIRALKGVLDLTGAGVESTRQIFDSLSNTMGATDEAFEKTSKTASFQMTQGLNAMKSSLLTVGQVILTAVAPAVQKIGAFFTSLSEKFKALSPTTQKIIVAFAGIVAALGPVIAIIGTLLTMAPAIGAAISLMLGPIGLIVAGLTAVSVVIYKNWAGIRNALIKIGNYFIELYNNSLPIQLAVNSIIMVFKNLVAVGKFVFSTLSTIIKLFGQNISTVFGSAADLIMGIFTFDIDKIKSGFNNLTNGLKDNFTNAFENIKTEAGNLGSSVADNFNEALKSKQIAPIKIPVAVVSSGGGGDEATTTGEGGIDAATTTSGGGGDISTPITNAIKADTAGIPDAMAEQNAVLTEQRTIAMENAMQFNAGLTDIINGGLNQLATGIGEALGKAISGGGSLAQNLSKVVLTTVGGMAVQLGKLAISIGLAVEGIKKALQSLNPAVAVAAGIALIALGSFAKSQAGKIAGGGGGGATAFAKGGIVSGPTMGLVGEYPGAKSNPEVIAPLNKLQGMIGASGGGGGNVNVTGSVRVEGQDLLIAIERANETANRIY